jgi:3-deoxy-D-manno-octulosonate 8-phosphate phosphatase (KDO 8-P phosphatase)
MATARPIRLVILDVDGVLTDGTLYYGVDGDAMKGFSARDGMGISLARISGLKTAILTGRRSPMVERRAAELHIDYVLQDVTDKLNKLEELCQCEGISLEEIAYMGDDLNDIAVIDCCGLGACPADGCAEARQAADFVAACTGGHGAVRELIEHILKQQGKWQQVLATYGAVAQDIVQ